MHSRRTLPTQRSAIAFARRADRGLDDARTGRGEHLVEDAGEFGIPVADEELDGLAALTQVHEQISCLLGGPGSGWAGRGAHDVDGPGGVLDEEQDVDPFEEHGVYVEQIAGEDPLGLCLQELAP